jgi:sporulation protein YlmC with PRC-barrel domain
VSGGRRYDAVLSLLDRQIVDPDGSPLANVDDVELETGENGELWVSALLAGPAALGPRIGGFLGRWMTGASERLTCGRGPVRIPIGVVTDIGSAVTVTIRESDLTGEALEDWLREHVVARIPGATNAPE